MVGFLHLFFCTKAIILSASSGFLIIFNNLAPLGLLLLLNFLRVTLSISSTVKSSLRADRLRFLVDNDASEYETLGPVGLPLFAEVIVGASVIIAYYVHNIYCIRINEYIASLKSD